MRAGAERGAGAFGSLLMLFFGGGAAMVVVALFLTGVAQREIVPRVRARADRALKREAKPDSTSLATSTPFDSTARAAADSLAALRSQLETQRRFLQVKEESMARLRGSIDSVMAVGKDRAEAEVQRQAKLLGAMKADEAALVLAAMDDQTVTRILNKMNARAAAKVMARLDAARVARLSTQSVLRGDPKGMASLNRGGQGASAQ